MYEVTNGENTNGAGADADRLLDLAMLQGNRFIKELLRAKQLPIGTNKEQFVTGLLMYALIALRASRPLRP